MGTCCCNNDDGAKKEAVDCSGHSETIFIKPKKDNNEIMDENFQSVLRWSQNVDEKFKSTANTLDALIDENFKAIDLKVKKLDPTAKIPEYAHKGDAGFDLSVIVDLDDAMTQDGVMGGSEDTIMVAPGGKYIAKTGLAFAVPLGYELQVRPRSGLAYKHGITVINSPGTVDSGYNGEVMVIMLNTGEAPFKITTGDRIAQAVINKIPTVSIREVDDLDETERGDGGFGSTGTK